MNSQLNAEFRDRVILAMNRKAWSHAATARAAGVSETTITKITRAQSVSATSIGKVAKALDIEPLASVQDREGYVDDIELVRDFVGMILRDLSPEARKFRIQKLLKAIVDDTTNE